MLVGLACLAAIGLSPVSLGAPVTWGSWAAVTGNTAIQTLAGYTTYGGVNFNGANTTISNGSLDVLFTGIASNASGSAAGITVGSSCFAFQSTGASNSNVVSAVGAPTTWATVLDRVIGDTNNDATVTLSGLTPGGNYYVQFFSSTPDASLNQSTGITSGGVQSATFGSHAGGVTRSIIATFTADGAGQSFSITGAEPTFGALVIGAAPVTDSTPPALTGGDIVDNQGGGPVTVNSTVTYTVTFSEDIAAATVTAADFENAGTAAITFGTIAQSAPGIFSVPVTPTTAGSLILQIKQNTVIEDLAGNDLNTTSAIPDDTTITVNAETTPPEWIAGWPQAFPLSSTSISARARINEAGTVYYVVLADGATAPTAAQVKAGNDASNSPALRSGNLVLIADTEGTAPVAGLATDSAYDVYFVAEDAVANLQASPAMAGVSLSSSAVEPLISELVAVGSTFQDEDLAAQDWIEIHNPNGFAIDLAGYYLTDDVALLTKWAFPPTTLAAGGYRVVFASDKNRAVPGLPLHTNFKLGSGGEYLALVKPDGVTVASQYAPGFPGQIEGYSYGRNASPAPGYFAPPTPGAANGSLVPPLAAPVFSPACRTFTGNTSVTISESIPGAGNVIRYTTNGNEPTNISPLYPGSPITISSTTHLRARVFSSSGAAGAITGGLYQELATTSNLAGINSPSTFQSDLPILVVENFVAGAIPAIDSPSLQTARLAVYDPPAGASILSGAADACFRIGIKRRGNSSRDWDKGQYRVELRDEADGDLNASLLGLPAESDWTLHGPFLDKSLIRP